MDKVEPVIQSFLVRVHVGPALRIRHMLKSGLQLKVHINKNGDNHWKQKGKVLVLSQ
jgi:hypothetical protein